MGSFSFFIRQGLSHISDITAYDHILFVVALCALYTVREWKQILWMVTAFTVGHSIALALAVFKVVEVDTALVEFLIPVTIIITCIYNVLQVLKKEVAKSPSVIQTEKESNRVGMYSLILFFGVIHGVGFSNYLRFILTQEESLTVPLLGFNLGLELGQLAIVVVALLLSYLFLEVLKITQRLWVLIVSSIIGIMAIQLAIDTGKELYFSL
ncbi:MAG: HupE/UreJ family protein [Aureispira sp.]|nr:HupE/UreJ family protein [Aureispira sp.]